MASLVVPAIRVRHHLKPFLCRSKKPPIQSSDFLIIPIKPLLHSFRTAFTSISWSSVCGCFVAIIFKAIMFYFSVGSADIDVEGSLESLFHLSGGSLSGSPADDGSLAPNPIILSVSGAPTLFEHAKVYSFTLSEASVHLHVSLTVISDISLFAACDQWQRSLRDFLKHSFINHHLQQNLLHSRKCFSRVDQRIHACIYLLSAFRPRFTRRRPASHRSCIYFAVPLVWHLSISLPSGQCTILPTSFPLLARFILFRMMNLQTLRP